MINAVILNLILYISKPHPDPHSIALALNCENNLFGCENNLFVSISDGFSYGNTGKY